MAKGKCSVAGCELPMSARGMCSKHYARWARFGTTELTVRGKSEAERFWMKVDKDGPVPAHRPELGPCWLWTASRLGSGYGQLGRGGYAHRWSYEESSGPIPKGLEIDHLCRNPPCVNPAHLEAVTHAENVRRAAAWITHCPAGHLYDEANTYRKRDGSRICRRCHSRQVIEAKQRKRGDRPRRFANAEKTHCPQGHPYDEINTRYRPNGSRDCRACHREQEAARARRKRLS